MVNGKLFPVRRLRVDFRCPTALRAAYPWGIDSLSSDATHSFSLSADAPDPDRKRKQFAAMMRAGHGVAETRRVLAGDLDGDE